jgi:hypothetical protein
VNGKDGLWQYNLTLLSAKNLDRAKAFAAKPQLPEGKYLMKLYLDREGKLAKDWKAELVEKDHVGELEITSNWPAGYGAMTAVKFAPKK